MIKAILFDFGGTIDTDGIHWSEKFWDIYQRLQIPVSKPDYERAYVRAETDLAQGLIKHSDTFLINLEKQAYHQILFLKEDHKLESIENPGRLAKRIAEECYQDVLATLENVKPVLHFLKEKYLIGLVSNFNGNLDTVAKELGLFNYLDSIIDSAIVGVAKPDPEIFRLALKDLDVEAKNAAAIGDSYERDIVPAKILGSTTIWLRGKSWREPEDTEMADFTIRSISQVPDLIKGNQLFS
jgi:HAD superfamily hydrolase (TIGR01549 family)